MKFSSVMAAFNALDSSHKMVDWDNNRDGALVAKVTFCPVFDADAIFGTWVPLDLHTVSEAEFVQKLHSFVSAYPDKTHLHYSGGEEIGAEAFFFVMWDHSGSEYWRFP